MLVDSNAMEERLHPNNNMDKPDPQSVMFATDVQKEGRCFGFQRGGQIVVSGVDERRTEAVQGVVVMSWNNSSSIFH